VRLTLIVLAVAVALVLLIACANVANLMLVRASARQRDTALRRALGAGTAQIVRLLLAESLLLAAAGAAAGVGLAKASLVMLAQFQPDIPRIGDAALTAPVLLTTMGVSILAALLFSIAPLLDLRRADLREALTAGARGASGGPAMRRARGLLVACQMALACVLLVSGGLLLRSLENLIRIDPGFTPGHALRFELSLPASRYPDARAQTLFYRSLIRELSERPGVSAAGGLLYFPYRPKLWLTMAWPDGSTPVRGQEPVVFYNLIAGDYFLAMGIPLKAGRLPTPQEMWDESGTVVVNETLARQLFPRGGAVGARLRTGETSPPHEIVGVVGDVRQKRLEETPKPEVYVTFSSMPMPFLSIVTRTRGDAASMLDAVRGVVRARDAGLAIAGLMPLDGYVEEHTSDRRFALTILGLFAALALGLGAVGLYGVVSYSVAQRQREIAIRLALGAVPSGVRSMVVFEALRMVGGGAIVGLVAAAAAGRLMQGVLFGVAGVDPLTFAAVPAALVVVAVLASWIPARRAARVDAIGSLRGE
jgi:predicted permease